MSRLLNSVKNYASLVRFSHTVFAMPFALASMFVAADGLPPLAILLKILLCMVTARNTAMAFNRWIDADVDAKNPRTAQRHIPAGLLKSKQVLVFALVNAAAFIACTWWLNSLAFYLSVPTIVVLCSYSLWKRFHWGAHLFLGIAVGLSPLGAWVAVRGELALIPLLFSLMLAFWIAGFDIFYAMQDRVVDVQMGLHSIPVRFGEKGGKIFAAILHLFMPLTGFILGMQAGWFFFWNICLAIVCLALMYIHLLRKSNSLDSMKSDFFIVNALTPILCMFAVLLEVFVG